MKKKEWERLNEWEIYTKRAREEKEDKKKKGFGECFQFDWDVYLPSIRHPFIVLPTKGLWSVLMYS